MKRLMCLILVSTMLVVTTPMPARAGDPTGWIVGGILGLGLIISAVVEHATPNATAQRSIEAQEKRDRQNTLLAAPSAGLKEGDIDDDGESAHIRVQAAADELLPAEPGGRVR